MSLTPPPWFLRPAVKPAARTRLFCFPFAGAGASVFFPWAAHFRDQPVELFGVQLPGRETRIKEAPFVSLGKLIAALAAAIQPFLDKPFCFFGHSMGTVVSFELMREMRRRGWPLPNRAIMSGSPPPNVRAFTNVHHLSDDQILAALSQRYRELPDGLMGHPGLRELVMPALRADLEVIETYDCRSEQPFGVPLTVVGGVEDPSTPRERLVLWREHTSHPLKLLIVPGGHFYLRPPPKALLQTITEDLGIES